MDTEYTRPRWYDDGYGWVDCEEDDVFLTTQEMSMKLKPKQKAYVINHRGYKAHVEYDLGLGLVWALKRTQKYRSDFRIEEIEDENLKWIIV